MKNIFEKYQKIIEDAKKKQQEMERKASENPEQYLNEIGIDPNNLDLEELKNIASNLTDQVKHLEDIFKGKNFKDLNNFQNKNKNNSELTNTDKKKLEELGIRAFYSDLEQKSQFCFIENDCDRIIDAHSIQENGELSMIAKDGKVLHFIQNAQNGGKEKKEIKITKASTFKGFCHKHDQIFEPIDKRKCTTAEQENFLYSVRSFAYSYHNIKSFKDYFLNFVNKSSSSLNPLINSIKDLADSIGMKLPDELSKSNILEISEEQMKTLEIERFEKHRKLLKEFIDNKSYNELEYIIYEKGYLCPIACSSWMVLHIQFGNGFLISSDGKTPYYGFPIIISVIPFGKKTKIILSRFKADNGSKLIFNQWLKLISEPVKFEKELSKLIIENVENFYLSLNFWDKLNESEKTVIINAVTIKKNKFPEQSTNFEIINFFDQKYQIS